MKGLFAFGTVPMSMCDFDCAKYKYIIIHMYTVYCINIFLCPTLVRWVLVGRSPASAFFCSGQNSGVQSSMYRVSTIDMGGDMKTPVIGYVHWMVLVETISKNLVDFVLLCLFYFPSS